VPNASRRRHSGVMQQPKDLGQLARISPQIALPQRIKRPRSASRSYTVSLAEHPLLGGAAWGGESSAATKVLNWIVRTEGKGLNKAPESLAAIARHFRRQRTSGPKRRKT
jgi:hypothetical protein